MLYFCGPGARAHSGRFRTVYILEGHYNVPKKRTGMATTQAPQWERIAARIVAASDYPRNYQRSLCFLAGALIGGLIGTLIGGILLSGWMVGAVIVAGNVLGGLVGVFLNVRDAKASANRRYQNHVARTGEALAYFAQHLGDEAALALATLPRSGADLYRFAGMYQRLGANTSRHVVEEMMQLAYNGGTLEVIQEIQKAIDERGRQGWSTEQDVYDVTPAVLAECVASGVISARRFRDGLRRVLYAVEPVVVI
jgi:hypothetical protein